MPKIKYHCIECDHVWIQEAPAKGCPNCGAGADKVEVYREEEHSPYCECEECRAGHVEGTTRNPPQ